MTDDDDVLGIISAEMQSMQADDPGSLIQLQSLNRQLSRWSAGVYYPGCTVQPNTNMHKHAMRWSAANSEQFAYLQGLVKHNKVHDTATLLSQLTL